MFVLLVAEFYFVVSILLDFFYVYLFPENIHYIQLYKYTIFAMTCFIT
jgi:hypothetical protein